MISGNKKVLYEGTMIDHGTLAVVYHSIVDESEISPHTTGTHGNPRPYSMVGQLWAVHQVTFLTFAKAVSNVLSWVESYITSSKIGEEVSHSDRKVVPLRLLRDEIIKSK